MFSGLMSSLAMCREHQRISSDEAMKPPIRFIRNVNQKASRNPFPLSKRSLDSSDVSISGSYREPPDWQCEYASALLYGGETLSQRNTTHRDHALLSRYRQDGVVAPGSPGCRVDKEVDSLIGYWDRRHLCEHDIQIDSPKDLLQRVESEPTQFALDEVGAILHDCLQLDMPVSALPPRDEVEHVRALDSLASLPAGIAGQSDAQCGEDWEICGLVSHSQESREEVDLASDSGNGQKAGSTDD